MHPEMPSAILIEGDGIASACVARLLTDADVSCMRLPNVRPKLAAILLGEQTQHLLREIFPVTAQHPSDLFEGFVPLKRRVVLWGSAAEPLNLPHSAVVAPEAELLRRLWERVPRMAAIHDATRDEFSWRIQTSRKDAVNRPERSFGNRQADFAQVTLHEGIAQDACWVESVAAGWLFLLALGAGKATLIAVGDTPESLLAGSRLVAPRIARVVASNGRVPAHPRITNALADAAYVACGSAAMSFDPLCGEGAGNAVREAYLAAAVVRASLAGLPRKLLAAHYTDRLRRGFLRHLQICLQFYSTGGSGDFWKAGSDSLMGGIQEVQQMIEQEPTTPFRLVGRDLVPVQV